MIEKLITRLEGVKRTGPGRYTARCPAHHDKSPSLVVAEREGKIC
jgi:DNA primase